MYKLHLPEELKSVYSFERLKDDILKLIKPPEKLTQAIAEVKLETWLDSSLRNNPEDRLMPIKNF